MTKSLFVRVFAVLMAVVLIAGACGDDDSDGADGVAAGEDATDQAADGGTLGSEATDAPAGGDEEPTPTPAPTPLAAGGDCGQPEIGPDDDATDLSVKPPVQMPATAPTELVTEDVVVGTGDEVATGDFVIVEYVGVACSTGEQFDASWDRGEPFTLTLGAGDVIPGWDEGIVGMAIGGRRSLVIPPDLAYGDIGSGSGSIVPGETIVFVVDLLGAVSAEAELPAPTIPDQPATALSTTDLVVGEGPEAVADSIVWVHYRGAVQSTGKEFDASLDRGIARALAVQLSDGQLIEGMLEGITGMKVGGVREIVIPAEKAYGDAGAGDGEIGPNETLVFVVSLHGVLDPFTG